MKSCASPLRTAVLVSVLLCLGAAAQGVPPSQDGGSVVAGDSLSKIILNPVQNQLPQDRSAPPRDTAVRAGGASSGDTLLKSGPASPNGAPALKAGPARGELTNIVLTTKNIRAFGWGEYRVGGRCLCCDNMLDGDCIIVHNTNRTDRIRIKQIVDGKTEADTVNKATYFGDVDERDRPVPVTLLMAEITLNKARDIRRVTVYTMVDKEKTKSFLPACELGYYDQFDRLQWAGKLENKGNDDHITFELERPVLTGSILLKVKGGRSRITEVAIFAEDAME